MSKNNSQFNFGMQPVMYLPSQGVWIRAGDDVCYYKNHYYKYSQSENQNSETSDDIYATFSFSITFPSSDDMVYLAYHFPYTYSDVQNLVMEISYMPHVSVSLLAKTLSGLRCDLLTVTSNDPESLLKFPIESRKYVFLSARVHPGESNSSHIMNGLLKFLVNDSEVSLNLRNKYIFKIIPMLNPDGVYFGCHRTSLAGVDLNRQWKEPNAATTPTIYRAKHFFRHLITKLQRTPIVIIILTQIACDIHGHSRKKNVFMFGNSIQPEEPSLPQIFSQICENFDMTSCAFSNDPAKEGTARVVWLKEFGILQSYTLESSYCGASIGEMKGLQYRIEDLNAFGEQFCVALNEMEK